MIYLMPSSDIINQAALAHLGERQTEVHFESSKIQSCDFWRYCVRSTEAAFLTILGGAIGSAFGCYDRKVQATGRFLVRSQAEEYEGFSFADPDLVLKDTGGLPLFEHARLSPAILRLVRA